MRTIIVLLTLCLSPFIEAASQDIENRITAVELKIENADSLNVGDGAQQAGVMMLLEIMIDDLREADAQGLSVESQMKEIEEQASEL